MEATALKYWKALPALVAGALAGLFMLVQLRVEYYRVMDLLPHTAPQIAFYFLPLLLVPVLALALPLEALFRRYWHAPANHGEAALAGLAYPLLLSWWVLPEHGMLFLTLNPLVARAVVGLALRSRRPALG